MATRQTDRASRLMAAALSRRQALQGAAGSAAILLAGNSRRARAATVNAEFPTPLDLSCAVVFPFDLGERFGLAGGISYRGASGAIEGRALDEQTLQALGSTLDRLVGGHTSAIAPLDGSQDEGCRTYLLQFDSSGTAREALEALGQDYFGGTEEITPPDARGRFFYWEVDQGGSLNDVNEISAVAWQAGDVVAIVICQMVVDAVDVPDSPDPDDVVDFMEDLRRKVATRLRMVLDPESASLASTIPTAGEIGSIASGGFTFGIYNWYQVCLFTEGNPVRQTYQDDEAYQRFLENHPELVEAFARIEMPRTFEGNQVIARIDAYRYANEAAARRGFDEIEARTTEETEREPNFEARRIDPPDGVPDNLAAQFFDNTMTSGDSRQRGVSGWFHHGTDVFRFLVAGPPRPADQDDDPGLPAILGQFVAIGSQFYIGWSAGTVDQTYWELMQSICPSLDQALASSD